MIERSALLGGDVQVRRPSTQLSLSRVGVTRVEKVVRVRSNGAERSFGGGVGARYVERFGHLDENAFVSARQENLETIHNHSVVTERHGLVGELRREVTFGKRMRHHVTKREWLEDVSRPGKA